MEAEINSYFNSSGFGFPETSEEIMIFHERFKFYEFKCNPENIDPKKILDSINSESQEDITKVDYHKRTVLAAEIVYQLHEEWTLGHLKLQKLIYLCQNSLDMPIHAKFLKQAMGPYDPHLMRSIDSQFKRNRWFEFRRNSNQKYWPLDKIGGHKLWYERYYHDKMDAVSQLIETFKKAKSNKVELVATIFACWKEIINEEQNFNKELLYEKFYKWSDEKIKFTRQEVDKAVKWMYENNIYPVR